MAAVFTSMQQHANCCFSFAAACTSARVGLILDTVIMAVSIFVILIMGLLVGMT